MLKEKIEADLKESIKQRNSLKTETLRFIKAALQNAEIEKNKKELTEEETIRVLKKLRKQRKESIEAFKKGNRPELAKKESEELALLNQYLPEELSQQEIAELVIKAIEETGAKDRKDTGKVMKNLMAKAKGKLDGKIASSLVSKELERKVSEKEQE